MEEEEEDEPLSKVVDWKSSEEDEGAEAGWLEAERSLKKPIVDAVCRC